MDISAQQNQQYKVSKTGVLMRLIKAWVTKEKSNTLVTSESNEIQDLLENIKNARHEWMSANINFEFACEDEMVDYYTYKIKACEVRYQYLLKKAKKEGIKVELIDSGEGMRKESATYS